MRVLQKLSLCPGKYPEAETRWQAEIRPGNKSWGRQKEKLLIILTVEHYAVKNL